MLKEILYGYLLRPKYMNKTFERHLRSLVCAFFSYEIELFSKRGSVFELLIDMDSDKGILRKYNIQKLMFINNNGKCDIPHAAKPIT